MLLYVYTIVPFMLLVINFSHVARGKEIHLGCLSRVKFYLNLIVQQDVGSGLMVG